MDCPDILVYHSALIPQKPASSPASLNPRQASWQPECNLPLEQRPDLFCPTAGELGEAEKRGRTAPRIAQTVLTELGLKSGTPSCHSLAQATSLPASKGLSLLAPAPRNPNRPPQAH